MTEYVVKEKEKNRVGKCIDQKKKKKKFDGAEQSYITATLELTTYDNVTVLWCRYSCQLNPRERSQVNVSQ